MSSAHVYDWYEGSWGERVDLNDPATYEKAWEGTDYLSMSAKELRAKIEESVGCSLYYMICWRPDTDWDKRQGPWPGQYSRVVEFGRHFARECREPDRRDNIAWLRKQLFIILDETENQC